MQRGRWLVGLALVGSLSACGSTAPHAAGKTAHPSAAPTYFQVGIADIGDALPVGCLPTGAELTALPGVTNPVRGEAQVAGEPTGITLTFDLASQAQAQRFENGIVKILDRCSTPAGKKTPKFVQVSGMVLLDDEHTSAGFWAIKHSAMITGQAQRTVTLTSTPVKKA